jgi:hypothetical protein
LRDAYAPCARRVENEAQVVSLGLTGEMLTEIETFSCLESSLFDAVEGTIIAGQFADALRVSERRRTSSWSLGRTGDSIAVDAAGNCSADATGSPTDRRRSKND